MIVFVSLIANINNALSICCLLVKTTANKQLHCCKTLACFKKL